MKVAIVDTVNTSLAEQLLHGYKVEAVIYAQTEDAHLSTKFPSIRWIDFSTNLADGIDFAYNLVRERLEALRKKHPDFFLVGVDDFFEALNNDLFWSQFNSLLYEFALRKLP